MTVSQPYAAPPAWQPPPVKPPLTPRQKSGARLAGIFGFLLLTLGFTVFGLPLVLLAIGAFFALIVGVIGGASGNDEGFRQFMDGIGQFHPEAFILPLILVSLVGLAIMVGALFLSRGILRSHDIARPWAVTWAGAGIAIVASWILSGVSSFSFSLTGVFGDRDEFAVVGIIVAIIGFIAGVAATAVIGWLSWWWMAHVMRSPALSVIPPQLP